MMKVGVIALIVVATSAAAQYPASSPALDLNYSILAPKETFEGRYANTRVGDVIKTVTPLRWDIPKGGVFLNCVDTLGDTPSPDNHPTGPFLQGPEFSLFNRAVFRLKGTYQPTIVFNKGARSMPVLAAEVDVMSLHIPDSLTYTDSGRYLLFRKDTTRAFTGDDCAIKAVYWDKDTLQDLILFEHLSHPTATKTHIFLWKGEDLVYRGDIKFSERAIPATEEYVVPSNYFPYGLNPEIADFDGDGVPDIAFIGDSLENGNTVGPRYVTITFGKYIGAEWAVDTTILSPISPKPYGFKIMDFLHNDGRPDILLTTNDTIYCFSAKNTDSFRRIFSLADAELKIPSPAKLDPHNFLGDGQGALDDWGKLLFDAGNVNGFGQHSLAVHALYIPNQGSFSGISYCFIYSGGLAADERADALFGDISDHGQFTSFDTVWVGDDKPNNILVGDYGYTLGYTGIVFNIPGKSSIPHNPDPRWLDVTRDIHPLSDVSLDANSVFGGINITVNSALYATGTLVIHDILGREIHRQDVYFTGGRERKVYVNTSGFSTGIYVISYEEDGKAVNKKVFIY